MQLFIRAEDTYAIEVDKNETICQLKKRIEDKLGSCCEDLLLEYGGSILDDDSFCCALEEHSTLNLNVRLPGGKVHGSLARAGKVKGQTPKVDKQEKHKKKTGRAKRRFQYNRRFANVVPTFGRRKGPNSNAK